MVKKFFRLVFSLIGGVLFALVVFALREMDIIAFKAGDIVLTVVYAVAAITGVILFYVLSPKLMDGISKVIGDIAKDLSRIPASDIIFGSIGLIIGLIIAFLISQPLYNLNIPFVGSTLSVLLSIILYFGMGLLGITVATKNKADILQGINRGRNSGEKARSKIKEGLESEFNSKPKILDTSVIIDGRIADIAKTGFIDGPLVIPVFVLEELQHIADSPDGLRRERGRRGLDILKIIQKDLEIEVIITQQKYDDIHEVDSKLIKLTEDMKGKIVTNDYNLNKVAEVQGIEVLNVNELANAVKPVVIPGEEMNIDVIKEGKETNQGLAYLNDGTMIVVENGRRAIGKNIDVVVTSVLQTAAGKMIFARPK